MFGNGCCLVIGFCDVSRTIFDVGKNNRLYLIRIYRNGFTANFVPRGNDRDNVSVRVIFCLVNIVDTINFLGNLCINFDDDFFGHGGKSYRVSY